jgi:hypothetical protein
MVDKESTALELIERLKRKAPEYLDLLTATTDEEFYEAFDAVLGLAVAHLEKNKKNFDALDEEGLTGALAGALSIPGLTVTQETNSNGHVDLTVDADHCSPPRTLLGEAKIYKGRAYHLKGLDQIIAKYATGREGRSLLLSYVKQANISGLSKQLRVKMDGDLPQQQTGPTKDHQLKWSFRSDHKHASGDDIEVCHIMCNLH